MEQLNKMEPTKIFKEEEFKYYINYNQDLGKYIKGGVIEEVKIPKKIQYISYKEYMKNPKNIFELDYSKNNRNCLLHCLILSIQKFFDKNKFLPDINNDNQAEEIVKYSKEFYLLFKNEGNILFKNSKCFDDDFIKKLALLSRTQLPTDSSFLGGVLSQEILKFSGLYKPLNQMLYYNNYVTIENLKKDDDEINLFKKDRYYYENIIYGQNLINKLKKLNIFIVGAGALGCELMKIFALIGASTEENSNIILADNDSIELSNLNRQFFFNKKHIGKNKAVICCQEAKKINPNLNCIAVDKLVNQYTEDIFTDDFWSHLDIVILAVDNVSARRYIDKKCTAYKLKLIEIGTQGVKASSSLILPNLTNCYNDIKRNPKKEIPQCTLKYYPITNIHCIEYAKQKFEDFFHYNIKDTLEYIKLKSSSSDCYSQEYWRKLIYYKYMIKILANKNFNDCLNLAINEFYFYFNYNIRVLLNAYPPDKKKSDGTLFWNGDKRMPKEINFDINDDNQINFIYYYAYLLAKNLKIEIKEKNFSKDYINNNLIGFQKIFNEKEISEQIKILKEENIKEINKLNIDEWENIEYEEFEKDNDSNHHIDFLTAFSNLRAKNYKIEQCDKNLVKFISGKIIPAISTTTAAVCGFILSQIYILLRENYINKDLRTINFTLASPFFSIVQPGKVNIISNKKNNSIVETKVPYDFTIWDKIEIEGNISTNELTEKLIKICGFDFEFDGIYTIDNLPLIMEQDDMDKLIQDIYFKKVPKECENNILLKQMGISQNKEFGNIYIKYYGLKDETIIVLFPIIKYHYKKC